MFQPTSIIFSVAAALLSVPGANANPLQPRDDLTATVDLSTTNGQPQHLASGFIYGIPDNYPNQIPDHWYSDIDFNYGRVGGAQLGEPARGWIWGMDEFSGRVNSAFLNYEVCRQFDANVIVLVHDIWGTDSHNSSTVWPGDDGDWTDWDLYVANLLDSFVSNDMLEGLVIDIWNEPDQSTFWQRDVQQWVDLYIRTHKAIRSDSRFDGVKISGPSLSGLPASDNEWWTTWLQQIAGNSTVPDQWSYHMEHSLANANNDPLVTNATLAAMLEEYQLPEREVNVNEYAILGEMHPSGYAWWIARLERYNFWGLLGNWASGTTLHDLFANLLTKESDPDDYEATDYVAAPGYWVYKYYNVNMTGERLATTGSGDSYLDVYATRDESTVRLLVGSRVREGTWTVQLNNLSSIGYDVSGTVSISTWGFDGADLYTAQAAPSFRNTYDHRISNDALAFKIYQNDIYTAWAFEFAVLN
ncbi:hypothetical protein PFICI_07447 [Pestalotiopsis fici W106-1]|uniref:Glycoside hydrolase family 39 protein n=1 Tax=Pestalotiopsis fici (strain W106-1 / CGMCC3.15140) TaxID=1229662 RepID=W3X1B6_PESFW|nr:uncharacterized protein PFICI_07447 [Pestalotiopsis fici W106-1]ETS79918.1 hypothetical protein PFICI_07447 [Pestalotiopsis fici W106-1]